jgi:hypothetical protein
VTTDEYQAVYVTIGEVRVHLAGDADEGEEGGWQVVAEPYKTYNLLELANGILEHLGTTDLEPGTYTQLRLMLAEAPDEETNLFDQPHPYASYVVDFSGMYHELKTPSGVKSGVKLVHPFEVEEDEETELILDFNAADSVVKAGRSGQYKLKPTIKVLNRKGTAVVRGTVTDNVEPLSAIGMALVSAQACNASTADEKDRVVVETRTITDEGGAFKMFLEPGEYFLVAYREGYLPDCAALIIEANASYEQDFLLGPASVGAVTVTIHGLEDDEDVSLSFRKQGVCEGDEWTEVLGLNLEVEEGEDYTISLPGGMTEAAAETYRVVASTDGQVAAHDIGVVSDENTPLAIDFTPEP